MMNNTKATLTALAIAATVGCALPGCHRGLEGDTTSEAYRTSTGAAIVETSVISATVAAINTGKRTVTLKIQPGGGTRTYTAAPSTDLSQISVGDNLKVTVTEEIVAALAGEGGDIATTASNAVAVAAEENSDEVLMANSATFVATVTALNTKDRKITLEMPDGTSKTIKVNKAIDLSQVSVGDSVNVLVAEALAIKFVDA